MVAQLLPAVLAAGGWSIQTDGTSWSNLGLIWLLLAGIFCGFSILRNRLPVSFHGRSSPKKDARPQNQSVTKSAAKEGLSSRAVLHRPRKQPLLNDGFKEKRASLRRKGKPVRILLMDAEASQDLGVGWVLDRSRGGLYLVVAHPVDVGTFLRIRPAHAPDTMPWVRVEIRRCRPKGNRWGLGCRFERELPWSELLLFG